VHPAESAASPSAFVAAILDIVTGSAWGPTHGRLSFKNSQKINSLVWVQDGRENHKIVPLLRGKGMKFVKRLFREDLALVRIQARKVQILDLNTLRAACESKD